jgi:hypothetical protein
MTFLAGSLALTWAAAAQNLLTVSPSFESGGPYYGWNEQRDQTFSFAGWSAHKHIWTFNRGGGVLNGDGSAGTRCFDAEGCDWLQTAASARPAVVPGQRYELRFSAKKTAVRTSHWAGIVPRLVFFRADGVEVKRVWGDEVLSANETSGWREFRFRAVAPAEAARVGIHLDFQYQAVDVNTDANPAAAFRVDDFQLIAVPEPVDAVAIRSAPRALEPGREARIKVNFAATAPRELAVRLVGPGISHPAMRKNVGPGRGLEAFAITVPAEATTGDAYHWEAALLPVGGDFAEATARREWDGVFVDLRESGAGAIAPTHTNLVYLGRWNQANGSRPSCAWTGSEIRARFAGTSLRAKFRTTDSTFTTDWVAVIDGDPATKKGFNVPGSGEVNVTVATGLSNGIHTVTFHRESEVSGVCEFLGLTLDAGRGLLRPEPAPTRRIEFFGDSVTSGGDGGSYTSYATTTARELGAGQHIASKGATGISGGFIFKYNGLYYWDQLNFDIWFTPPDGYPPNPYAPGAQHPDPTNRRGAPWTGFAQWPADAVVIAYGQNDQFGGGPWAGNYREFVRQLRRVYPQAHIFMLNTVMTGGDDWFQSACEPLLSDPQLNSDGRLHFRLFRPAGRGAHPSPQDHRDMALGNADYHSLAEWIEETVGWGVDARDFEPEPLPPPAPQAANTLRLDVPGLPDCHYVVEHSTNLLEWLPVHTNVAGFSLEVTTTGDAGFFRRQYAGCGVDFFYRPPVPSTPENLRVLAVSSNSVTLAWRDASANERGFTLQRRRGGGSFATVAQVPAGAEQYRDTGLLSVTEYMYRVQAFNLAGPSAWSEEARAWTEFAVLRAPDAPTGTVAGLNYRCFEGTWDKLPNFASLTPTKTGTVTSFSLQPRSRDDNFGLEFTGYVEAPADGTYTFSTASDDGSRLYIGSQLVADNDGLHGVETRSGRIGLLAGLHAIRVTFFEKSGGQELTVRWSGPGIVEQNLPAMRLFRTP